MMLRCGPPFLPFAAGAYSKNRFSTIAELMRTAYKAQPPGRVGEFRIWTAQ